MITTIGHWIILHKLSKFSDNCDNDNDGYNNDNDNIDGNYDNENDENYENNDDNNNRSLDHFAQAVQVLR